MSNLSKTQQGRRNISSQLRDQIALKNQSKQAWTDNSHISSGISFKDVSQMAGKDRGDVSTKSSLNGVVYSQTSNSFAQSYNHNRITQQQIQEMNQEQQLSFITKAQTVKQQKRKATNIRDYYSGYCNGEYHDLFLGRSNSVGMVQEDAMESDYWTPAKQSETQFNSSVPRIQEFSRPEPIVTK